MIEIDPAELEKIMKEIRTRKFNRDQMYLKKTKMSVMIILENDFREWIVQEIKDQLILVDNLQHSSNYAISETAKELEKPIREISKTHSRLCGAAKRYGKGGSKSRNEAENFQKFRKHVEDMELIINELKVYRELLDRLAWAQINLFEPDTSKQPGVE